MKQRPQNQIRPRLGPLNEAVRYRGISRSRLYEWARRHPGLIVKNGASSLVDYRIYDQLLDALPAAKLKGASDEALTEYENTSSNHD